MKRLTLAFCVFLIALLLVVGLLRSPTRRPAAIPAPPAPVAVAATPARAPTAVGATLSAGSTAPAGTLERGKLRPRSVHFDLSFLDDPASPVNDGDRSKPITLALYDDVRLNFYVDSKRQLAPGVFTVTGHTDAPLSLVVMAKVHEKVVATVVDPDHGEFTIEPTADPEVSVIYQVDQSALTCVEMVPVPATSLAGAVPPRADAAALAAGPQGPDGGARMPEAFAGTSMTDFWTGLSVPTSGTRIPVLGTYNDQMAAKAVSKYGSMDALRARMETGLELASAVMKRAGSSAYFELVGLAQITTSVANDPLLTLSFSAIVNSPEYAGLEARFHPALIFYISPVVDSPSAVGLGETPGRLLAVAYNYINSTATPHEIGHNFGMSHNVEDATLRNSRAYGYGWRTTATSPAVGDIMAYDFPGVTTFHLPLYSDPSSTFRGVALGSVEVADNARLARETTAATAAFATFQFGAMGDNWINALSTRGYVGSGEQVLIAGLVVSGTSPKQIALRGAGPSMAAAVREVLANPKIELYSGSTRIAFNDDWQTHPRAADLQALNLAPTNPKEAGMLVTLNPGAYTIILSGVDGATGVGLVEAYEMDSSLSRYRYWNSNDVSPGFNTNDQSPLEYTYDFSQPALRNRPVLFALNNTRAARFLIASRGEPAGENPGRDPFLQIIRVPTGVNPYTFSQTTIVASNDNWTTLSQADDMRRSGILGLNESKTAAVLVDVAPGADYYVCVTPGNPNLFTSNFTSGTFHISLYNITGTETVGEENRLGAVATRGLIGSGERVMIAGLIVKGTSSRTVFARVAGPSLTALGIQNAVANPKLTVYNSSGQVIAANDNWGTSTTSSMLQQWGVAPTNANEPALILTLAPGAYTVIADNNGQEGVANIEVYELR